jgi:arabinan endo-1,5-alpha-L-arabinosidase
MWAPEIHIVGGRYVAYFAGRTAAGVLSVGVAVSAGSITGPYIDPLGAPLVHNTSMGNIDPTFFADAATGRNYLIWKVDGNAVGQPTPIMQAELNADGTALTSSWAQILVNEPSSWEGVLVEAPWMVQQGGQYYLFYSANIFGLYAIGVARAPAATGPFVKLGAPIIANATAPVPPFVGPGHCSVLETLDGGWAMLYHVWPYNGTAVNFNMPRYMSLDAVEWGSNGWPSIAGRAPSSQPEPVP